MQIEITPLAVNLNYSNLNEGLGARPLIWGIRLWILRGLMNGSELGAASQDFL